MLTAKKKMFWKIRNRLIFSGLFLVATPIIFITIFSYFIGTVVIAQYGSIIVDNVMSDLLTRLKPVSTNYLRYNNSRLMSKDINQFADNGWLLFTTVFWENKDGRYKAFFKYPENFNTDKMVVDEFSGYFLLDDKLYLGVLSKSDTHASLCAYEIHQQFLDSLSFNSDFRVIFKKPPPVPTRTQPSYTDQLGTNTSRALEPTTTMEDSDNDRLVPLASFAYTFLDFNRVMDNKPLNRDGDFVLSMNYTKIYKKIVSSMSRPANAQTKQFIFAMLVPILTLIILSFFIGFRMVRVITRSINELTRGTQRIRNGDFSFRIKTRSGDQLQYLAESFNEMASGIDRLLIDEKEKHRLEEELRIARSIQLKLLPPDTFQTEDFELAAVNIPATEIAGDYFDYFYKKNEYLSLLVADVSGKGASAAFYMAELKGVINHLNREVMSPAKVIAECHYSLKSSFDRITFITMNMAQFNIPEKRFVLSRAGHTRALFYSAKLDDCLEFFPDGMAIGLPNFSADKIKEIEQEYRSGDILFLFSDGLSEIMNEEDEMLGINHLKRILCKHHDRSPEEIKQKMLDFSIKFSETGVNHDDLTFIILKVK